jgi:hypothetical protein
VHPVIELGSALKKRGHRATVITNPFFEQQARDAGLDFLALGTVQEAEAIIADPRLWHPTKSFACIAERAILPNIAPLYHIIRERRIANTVVAASALSFGARAAQEKLGVPLASVHLAASDDPQHGGWRAPRTPADGRECAPVRQASSVLARGQAVDRSRSGTSDQFLSKQSRPASSQPHPGRLCSLAAADDWAFRRVVCSCSARLATAHAHRGLRTARGQRTPDREP